VQNLDQYNINVVGTVMAQTVALDHYSQRVDQMLETFVTLNTRIEQTGMFDAMVSLLSCFVNVNSDKFVAFYRRKSAFLS
jgi:hypothetical protein